MNRQHRTTIVTGRGATVRQRLARGGDGSTGPGLLGHGCGAVSSADIGRRLAG
jgi:hypothetical protein